MTRLVGLMGLAALIGCASRPEQVTLRAPGYLERLTPYRVDIQQGNVVTRDQLALIKPGMPREEVRDILGSPMLTDVFHADRWDFVFVSQRSGSTDKAPTRLAVAVHFNKGVVERIVAPELPTEREFVAGMVDRRAPTPKVPPLELTQAQRDKLPLPVRSESAASPLPQGPARTYPPLEPR
ncbi:MAG: outer membrane protein assembly factor BamE [Betaproteobacteria bacterium]|nr:outer membrane protein assembly factor BamE [Betaproteobacteria bacterium]NBT11067.1 outer membrane protein assembly factor BamE [Betaproteobacteria bacterium]NBU50059.1 outer membrane protein assembly factor BamE [Betaproteobacteria bacterium]